MEFRILGLIFGKKSRGNRFKPVDHISKDARRTSGAALPCHQDFLRCLICFQPTTHFLYLQWNEMYKDYVRRWGICGRDKQGVW